MDDISPETIDHVASFFPWDFDETCLIARRFAARWRRRKRIAVLNELKKVLGFVQSRAREERTIEPQEMRRQLFNLVEAEYGGFCPWF